MFVLEAASQLCCSGFVSAALVEDQEAIAGAVDLKSSPTGSALRADLLELEKYHRRAVAVRQIAAEYSVDLVTGPGDKPDWVASTERVHSIDWLEQVGVQHTFKAMAGPRRTLNRTALVDAAAVLVRLSTSLKNGWNELRAEFAVPDAATQLVRCIRARDLADG